MNKTPKLSIVIPLYNKECYIRDTIESILLQHFADYEIIVVNDGSTDNSRNIVENIEDGRIRLINKNNEGVSATRNRGLTEAQGEYVCCIDADDVFLPCALVEFERLAKNTPESDILITSYVEKDKYGTIVKSCICKEGCYINPMRAVWNKDIYLRMGNIFIKRCFIQKVGLMRTDITLYEDKEWIIRLLRKAIVSCSNKVTLEYRRYGNGLSFNLPPITKDFANNIYMDKIQSKYERLILGDFLMRRFLRRIIAKDGKGAFNIIRNNRYSVYIMVFAFLLGVSKSHNIIRI